MVEMYTRISPEKVKGCLLWEGGVLRVGLVRGTLVAAVTVWGEGDGVTIIDGSSEVIAEVGELE